MLQRTFIEKISQFVQIIIIGVNNTRHMHKQKFTEHPQLKQAGFTNLKADIAKNADGSK
jgi:hypothetical protein